MKIEDCEIGQCVIYEDCKATIIGIGDIYVTISLSITNFDIHPYHIKIDVIEERKRKINLICPTND